MASEKQAVVSIDHWTNNRVPVGHPLSDRWSLIFEGKSILTFGSEAEALGAAAKHGWMVTATSTPQLAGGPTRESE